jgi:hypothetical protein
MRRAITVKHYRILLILISALALMGIGRPVSAQDVDLGNDGFDMNCEDFPEFNAANGYFTYDGGSVDRNVDDLDPNRDGIPCNEVPDDAPAEDPDLGNDGVDMDCDDFPERNAAEGYFAHDGGSAERNVDGLDPDGDGIPCNEAVYDGSDGGSDGQDGADQGSDVDAPADPVSDAGAPVVQLPVTGTGSSSVSTGAGVLALVGSLLAVAGAVMLGRIARAR